jgi:hypothetical protein
MLGIWQIGLQKEFRNESTTSAIGILNRQILGTDTDCRPRNSRGTSCLRDRGSHGLERNLDAYSSALVDRGYGHRVVGLFEILQWTLGA